MSAGYQLQFNFDSCHADLMNLDGSKIIFGLGVGGAVITAVIALYFAIS